MLLSSDVLFVSSSRNMMEKSIMVVMRQIMGMGIFGQLCESVLLIDTWLEFRAIQSEFVDHQSL